MSKNIRLAVEWVKERVDEADNNDGYLYGIYTFDCTEQDFDVEAGYGSYDVIDAQWYKSEKERDENLDM